MSSVDGTRNQKAHGRYGDLSEAYAAARKGFPADVIDFVFARLTPNHPLILDIACGTGIATRQLAERGASLVGCDLDCRMIGKAVGRIQPNISYVVGSAMAIPFESAVFDAVTCFGAFHWFDSDAALDEMRRVLRPGGTIAIANRISSGAVRDEFRKLVAQFADSALPDPKRGYDPARQLRVRGFPNIEKQAFSLVEYYAVAEAVVRYQSSSLWNLVPETRRGVALAGLNKICLAHADHGRVAQNLVIEMVIAAK